MLVFPVLLPGPGWRLSVVGLLVGRAGVEDLPGGGCQYGSVVLTPVPTAQYSPLSISPKSQCMQLENQLLSMYSPHTRQA